ncbi:hypothetical protein BD779DRAFT_1473432 [Infundibulicybe gibba]|nr:hypothetical protein BD779DRAFT_1473432 [Infundibulicybe gibba]
MGTHTAPKTSESNPKSSRSSQQGRKPRLLATASGSSTDKNSKNHTGASASSITLVEEESGDEIDVPATEDYAASVCIRDPSLHLDPIHDQRAGQHTPSRKLEVEYGLKLSVGCGSKDLDKGRSFEAKIVYISGAATSASSAWVDGTSSPAHRSNATSNPSPNPSKSALSSETALSSGTILPAIRRPVPCHVVRSKDVGANLVWVQPDGSNGK